MEPKQHVTKQPMGYWWNQRRKFKIPVDKTVSQNLWDSGKAILRGTFIVIQAHLRKQENFQIKNLIEKGEQTKNKISRRKQSWKIRAKINKMKLKKKRK